MISSRASGLLLVRHPCIFKQSILCTTERLVANVVAKLTDFYNNALKPAFDKFLAFVIPVIKDVFNFFVEEVLPVFKRIGAFLFNEVLPIIGVALVDTIDNFKKLFTDIVGAFDKILSGDFLGGISDLVLGIGRFVLEQIDIVATGIYNIIASLFGLEETDSIAGSIAKFFTDIYNNVVEAVRMQHLLKIQLQTCGIVSQDFLDHCLILPLKQVSM